MLFLKQWCFLLLTFKSTRNTEFSFKTFPIQSSRFSQLSMIEVGTTAEIPLGERKVVDTSAGSIIVANVDGSYYAVNAKCPHLGFPMKKAKIEVENGVPTITCNFHNSKFQLNDGKCTAWCTGVFNLPGSGFLGNALSNFGGQENSPATVYKVEVSDGKLFIQI